MTCSMMNSSNTDTNTHSNNSHNNNNNTNVDAHHKNISPEDQKQCQERVIALQQRPGNSVCADCSNPETSWASINLGVFVCIECSGVHRSLSVQYSKIRSISLDDWDQHTVKELEQTGNIKANEYWECNMFPFEKPLTNDPFVIRNHFIINKYINKKFVPTQNKGRTREFYPDLLKRSGYMKKQGRRIKSWHKRWFVLSADHLSYYKRKEDTDPIDTIPITSSVSVGVYPGEGKTKRPNMITMHTPHRNYYMYPESETEMVEWVIWIRGAIYNVKQSS